VDPDWHRWTIAAASGWGSISRRPGGNATVEGWHHLTVPSIFNPQPDHRIGHSGVYGIYDTHNSGETDKPVVPGADWERVAKPESIGYSSSKLEALRGWLKTQQTTSMVVSVGGRVLFEYDDPKYWSGPQF
jgi:hypothetical protein